MSSSVDSEYVPMESLALSTRTALEPREAAFLKTTNRAKTQIAASRVHGIMSDDPLFLAAAELDWQQVRDKIATKDAEFRQPVDTTINAATADIQRTLKWYIKEGDKEPHLTKWLQKLKFNARTDERGFVDLSAESSEMYDVYERLRIKENRKNNVVASEQEISAFATKRSTWTVKINPISLEDCLDQKILDAYIDTQRKKIPTLANRLTEELKSKLSSDPEILRATHQYDLLDRLGLSPEERCMPKAVDELLKRYYPKLNGFFSALSQVTMGAESETEICNSIKNSLTGIIDRKAENGYPEMGLSNGLYLDLQLHPDRLDDPDWTDRCCSWGVPKAKLGQNSVQFQIRATNNNGFLHGIIQPPSVDLSTTLAVEDREPFNITDI